LSFVNINGKLLSASDAAVSIQNSAFRNGLGLFETILVKHNIIHLQDFHFDRLFSGMIVLNLPASVALEPANLQREILRTVERNEITNYSRLRLEVYEVDGESQFCIEALSVKESIVEFNETGLRVDVFNKQAKSPGIFSNLKSTSYLLYRMAYDEAKKTGLDDMLILNPEGNLIESGIASLFCIKDGLIYTPPLSDGCIAGVMRKNLLAQLPNIGYMVIEQSITPEFLASCDEVFLSNAIRRIKWVQYFVSCQYRNEITARIHSLVFPS
jgi:branched-chain amino acid aminotransferase